MLDYTLHSNALTDSPDDMSAQTHPGNTYDRDAFINLMLQRGTLVTKTDILAVFNNMEETAAYITENGGTINLPLFSTRFSISGVFNGAADMFDGGRHKLKINVRKGSLLRDAAKRVKLAKSNTMIRQPQIFEVKDCVSGNVDSMVTAKGVLELAGSDLKIVGDNASVGLYFVSSDGTETKASTIITNKPSRVIAIVPALKTGMYKVKVVTQFSNSKIMKTVKEVVYNKPLKAS
jgi:hypothetical protein